MPAKKLIVRIYGRVQGVGFRYSAAEEAHKLKIKISARNEPDKSVFIEAEGEEQLLKNFLAWCEDGPQLAKVERVEHEWADS